MEEGCAEEARRLEKERAETGLAEVNARQARSTASGSRTRTSVSTTARGQRGGWLD